MTPTSAQLNNTEASSTYSKSQLAHAWLRQRISHRDFAPGFRLVLATIAQELHMSVVPVREAIRQLEAEGLVTFERNVGARVAMLDDSDYRHSMDALALLEAAATAQAAQHLTPADIRTARAINSRLAATLSPIDPTQFTAINREFHQVLYQQCPNPRLRELVDHEWDRLGRLRSSTFSFVPDRAQQSVAEHEHILDLIESGAPDSEVENVARLHTHATLAAYLAHEHPDSQR